MITFKSSFILRRATSLDFRYDLKYKQTTFRIITSDFRAILHDILRSSASVVRRSLLKYKWALISILSYNYIGNLNIWNICSYSCNLGYLLYYWRCCSVIEVFALTLVTWIPQLFVQAVVTWISLVIVITEVIWISYAFILTVVPEFHRYFLFKWLLEPLRCMFQQW